MKTEVEKESGLSVYEYSVNNLPKKQSDLFGALKDAEIVINRLCSLENYLQLAGFEQKYFLKVLQKIDSIKYSLNQALIKIAEFKKIDFEEIAVSELINFSKSDNVFIEKHANAVLGRITSTLLKQYEALKKINEILDDNEN